MGAANGLQHLQCYAQTDPPVPILHRRLICVHHRMSAGCLRILLLQETEDHQGGFAQESAYCNNLEEFGGYTNEK